MTFTLPFPPSSNRYWRVWRGRAVMSDEARAYKLRAALAAKAKRIRPQGGALSVTLRFFRPAKRGDLDNRIKISLDALNGIAWNDDAQVRELHAFLEDDKVRPRVEIEVLPLSEEDT